MIIPRQLRILLLLQLAPAVTLAQATLTGNPIMQDISRPQLESGLETTNVLWGDFAVSAIADDNNNYSITNPIPGSQFYFAPAIALQHTQPHLSWNIGYAPGLRINLPSSLRPTQLTQSLGGTLHWDVSKRLAVGLRQDYLRTNDPFQKFGEAPFQPDIGLLNRPPDLAFSALSYSELLLEGAADYKLDKHTLVGVNGSFMQLTGGQHPTQKLEFINSRISSGSAFLSHQFTARQTIGLQYQLLDMSFQGDSNTITQGLFLFDQAVLSPHTTLTIFAGPQYSRVHNQEAITSQQIVVFMPGSTTLWSPAAGGMLTWERKRTVLYADATRRVSAGLGLLSSAEMNTVSLNLQRKVTSLWIANVSGQVSDETLLTTPSSSRILLWNIRAGISREFSRDTHLRLAYQHIQQSGSYLYIYGPGNHNRFLLTFERSFAWPVGR